MLLALSWPLPVVLADPQAVRVWWLEMGQKTGVVTIGRGGPREVLATSWFWLTLPWSVVATWAAIEPVARWWRCRMPDAGCRMPDAGCQIPDAGSPTNAPVSAIHHAAPVISHQPSGIRHPESGIRNLESIWLPWCWTVPNLVMFCLWRVAKPSYFLPCLPGVALLVGLGWVRLAQRPGAGRPAFWARLILQVHWVPFFVAAAVLPVVVGETAPELLGWALGLAVLMAAAVTASAWLWRRGANAVFLAPLAAALAAFVLVGYGQIAPRENPARGHRRWPRRWTACCRPRPAR